MPFATTAAIVGGLSAASSIGGAALAAHGAGQQADAAKNAAELQHQDAQDALAYQKQKDAQARQDLAPWQTAGAGAVTSLAQMLNGGQFADWTGKFTAPDAVTEQNDPGFQFRMQQGQQALERSAAAKGNLLSGGTAKALTRYGQDYGSNEYQNVFNRSYQQYLQGYNEFQNNQTNRFNRFASLAGLGQNAATTLASTGQSSANNAATSLLGSGQQIGSDLQNAAAARASGYNAYANAFGGAANSVGNTYLMSQLFGQQNSNSPALINGVPATSYLPG